MTVEATIGDLLDNLYFSAKSEKEKGDRFERLVAKYLVTEPTFAHRFDQVWRWTDWPGREGQPDHGIDLVARERDGGMVAVQCKFYDPTHYLSKPDIDSFLATSGKAPFTSRLVVSTTDKWNSAAEAAIQNQLLPVSRIGLGDLIESQVDWSQFTFETPEVITLKGGKQLRSHQQQAVSAVRDGLKTADRGKLIMACGTGKTFTSLRIAEDLVPLGGRVLFLVPSIALLSQALREWSADAEEPLRSFAVCSDTKVDRVAKKTDLTEDITVVDLAIPATTDSDKLAANLTNTQHTADRRTVVFATYQSIDVVARAQKAGAPDFDLIICDEAHRTTGATALGAEESAFIRVHDNSYITAAKRIYMTATPRLYDDASKTKAGDAQAVLASMDDETLYGPELYRLGFGEAVSKGLLTDYKVLVLTVDEGAVSKTLQDTFAINSELTLPDAARIIGCWNGLAKRGKAEHGFDTDPAPMRTAVAFAQSIKSSKAFAEAFTEVADDYRDATGTDTALTVSVQHVDGTMNMLTRNERLDWLKTPDENQARILSNARCLSEGVDVPALDAVMFLNPRKSVVDVVQSVGRVMRLAPGKQYGYIILPVGIPAGMSPDEALKDNKRFAVVWEVLQALRAHDDRFDAMVNTIDLNKNHSDKLDVIFVDAATDSEDGAPTDGTTDNGQAYVQGQLQFQNLSEWRDAIYARLVTKVGTRRYWETWAKDVANIVERHTTRLTTLLEQPPTPELTKGFTAFHTALRANLNDSISRDDAIGMLSQHLVTKPVFDALFDAEGTGYSFTDHNPVARVMDDMIQAIDATTAGEHLAAETEALEGFYDSVRLRVAGIDNAEGKQKVITELYEKFFKLAFAKTADSLGVVYTPTEVVDFIIRAVNDLSHKHFGRGITDEGVHILDPFTGTGTFIVRLLQSGLIQSADLARKYTSELHANEILLLAYYIAAANIEVTYHDLAQQHGLELPDGHQSFDGIVLTDTFQLTEDDDVLDTHIFTTNNDRAEAQQALDIRVIIGNPPYSVGQGSANDNNANVAYPTLDKRIADTYAARSTATNKRSLYDSYIRAIRWSSDRIKDAGLIGFVTNGGFIDSNTGDGLRLTLAEEFAHIYIYNLRGNMRDAANWKAEGGQIFGAGSQTTVAVFVLVKDPAHTGPAELHYHDIGDYLTREQKLALVDEASISTLPWSPVEPNPAGDWLSQRSDEFWSWTPIADKDEPSIFQVTTGGLKTNRDAWVYGSSKATLTTRVKNMVDFYNTEVDRFALSGLGADAARDTVTFDSTRFSWNRADFHQVGRRRHYTADPAAVRTSTYRPFFKQHVHFARRLNDMVYRLDSVFPSASHTNTGFYVVGAGSDKPFSALATDLLPDLAFWGSSSGQYLARWTYEKVNDNATGQGDLDLTGDTDEGEVIDGYRRIDNITDHALKLFHDAYGTTVTKDDIFHYVYGILHSPDYRTTYAADLKKMLPRIPLVPTPDYETYRDAGKHLMHLHINYENAEPYADLTITGDTPTGPGSADHYAWYAVTKPTYKGTGKNKDNTTVILNPRITITGIPERVHDYQLGARSALDWLIDRYKVTTDKTSGIVNDPNDWAREQNNPRYILDLFRRIVTVSIETVDIVNSLPPLVVAEA